MIRDVKFDDIFLIIFIFFSYLFLLSTMSTYTYIRVNYTWLWENMADTSQFIFISHHAGCTEAKLQAKTDGRATSKRLTLQQIVAMSEHI